MRFSTAVTPGADQATRSASCFSAQERTVPLRITLLPCTSTVMRSASVSALRTSACSIFSFSSDGVTRGLTVIRLVTPRTPEMRRATRSASSFWYCHSTSPLRVTHPLETVTSIFSTGTKASHSRARMIAAARSASVRSAMLGSRTSMSLATALTPFTRWAASSAAQRLVYESTQPVSVTTPSFTATPISLGCTRASYFSSSSTSRWICSSVRVSVVVAIVLLLRDHEDLLGATPTGRRRGRSVHGDLDLPRLGCGRLGQRHPQHAVAVRGLGAVAVHLTRQRDTAHERAVAPLHAMEATALLRALLAADDQPVGRGLDREVLRPQAWQLGPHDHRVVGLLDIG